MPPFTLPPNTHNNGSTYSVESNNLNFNSDPMNSASRDARARREECYEKCVAPKRYTSNKNVINSPEETAKVEAEWNLYQECLRRCEEEVPYTEWELRHLNVKPNQNNSKQNNSKQNNSKQNNSKQNKRNSRKRKTRKNRRHS